MSWSEVRLKVQNTMKTRETRDKFESRLARQIDDRRALALKFQPDTRERNFLEGMITGMDLALTQFLMWEEIEK